MADIFISYSSRHRALTQALADALAREGHSVWWDQALEAYATFRDQIDAALSQARVVVVVWSEGAAASDYVIAEAREALETSKLVNTLAPGFDPHKIPKPFGEYQAEKVDNIDAVMRAIARRWAGERPEKLEAAAFYERASGKPALSPKRDAISTVAHVTPALLLNARLALAPYLDVHGLRAGMAHWAHEGRPVRGRLIHGPGGVGKTRLMAEVCADLRAQDWAAGFVETPEPHDADIHRQAIEHLIGDARSEGLLLVLDYAERRQDEAARYADLMAAAARKNPNRPLRLVLLARGAGEWWDRAVQETPALAPAFGGAGSLLQLAPFAETTQRERLFIEAGAGFRDAIAKARAEDREALAEWGDLAGHPLSASLGAELARDAYARPLMIQIAALLSLQGETPDGASVAALLDAMLGVERRYWKTSLANAHSEARQRAIARGTIQSTLVGGVPRTDAEALLLRDSYFARTAPADAAETLGDLERFYGDGAGALLALQPDLVGEHLAAAEGDERLIDACLDWAGDNLARRRSILTILNHATRGEHGPMAQRAQHLLEHVIRVRSAPLAQDLIAVALETPGELPAVLECLASALGADACENLHEAIPVQTLRLARLALPLAARSVERARTRDAGSARPQLAAALGWLGIRLSNLGRREEALQANAEAVAIRRELASQNRDAVLPDLALSLNNQSAYLSDVGRREEALQASAESVEIRRELAAQNRDAFLPNLAASLNNLGIRFSDLGRREEALQASTEGVAIRRELAAQNRDAFLTDLATSLNNMSADLSDVGRHEEAMQAGAEAVDFYRELAARNRDAFLPNLAASLNNLGARFSNLGRREEALRASAEAVTIRRELAAQNHDAFLPDLAASLSNQSTYLSKLGRREEALQASTEAVNLYRKIAAQNRDAFLPDLAMSLNNQGAYLSNLGRREEALQASAEAVAIRRELAAQYRDAFLPDLAVSLNNQGTYLSNLGRREEALQVSAEAVAIRRELAAQNRDAFLPDLARGLSLQGDVLLVAGQVSESIAAYVECARILKPCAEATPEAFGGLFGANLRDLSKALQAAGKTDEEIRAALAEFEIAADKAADGA